MARYYDKVQKAEYLAIISGPPVSPDIVELPPENTFWGEPLTADEELTYDANGLPNGRQPRTKDEAELIATELRDAGLTPRVLRQAQLADSRGNPAPLVAFNAALDVLIAGSPYTEAQFLEVL